MASIKDLTSIITRRGGYARPNRFFIDLSSLQSQQFSTIKENIGAQDLNFLIDSIPLPGKTTNTIEYSIWNHPIKIPVGYDEDDLEVVFNLTNDFFPRRVMDEWYDRVINNKSYLFSYDSAFKYDIKIYQCNEYNDKIYGIHVKGAYPISIKGILLDNNSESSISKFSTTLTFDRYDVIPESELKMK